MNNQEWERALDQAEQNPLTANLPKEAPPGMIWVETSPDGIFRKWVRVEIVAGSVGSRWAYWKEWKAENGQRGIGVHPQHQVIGDRIFNGDVAHFAGMLAMPYAGPFVDKQAWVLLEPRSKPPANVPERMTTDARYERSREVYDVETGEITPI